MDIFTIDKRSLTSFIQNLKAIRKEIVNTVNSLDNELLQKILIFRYIQKMEWQLRTIYNTYNGGSGKSGGSDGGGQ